MAGVRAERPISGRAALLALPLLALPLPLLRGAETAPFSFEFELACCLMALISGVALLNYATVPGRRQFLTVGCAFLVSASETVVAAVAALAEANQGAAAANWLHPGALVSRGLLPALLLLLAPATRPGEGTGAGARDGRVVFVVMVLAAALTALSAMLPLPAVAEASPLAGHPLDLLAAALYLGALVALTLGEGLGPGLGLWVAASVALHAAGHLFAGVAPRHGDALGDLSQLYLLIAAALPTLGVALQAPREAANEAPP